MPKSIQISTNAAQAALDAVNHRLKVHEEALGVVKGEVEWNDDDELESDEGTEVQNILNNRPTASDLEATIAHLKEARAALVKV